MLHDFQTRAMVSELKQKYPCGTEIKITQLKDGKKNIACEIYGAVVLVDSLGSILVNTADGDKMRVIPGIDAFVILNKNEISTESEGESEK